MNNALADESARLVIELHRAISDLDPARWRADKADAARAKLRELQARLKGLAERSWPEAGAGLRGKLDDLASTLAVQLPDEDVTASSNRARWMALRKTLVPSYEELQATLREYEIHVPSLRPTNYTRSIFHLANAALSVVILWAIPAPWWAVAIAVPVAMAGWTMEIARRGRPRVNRLLMKLFGPIAHPHETRRVNSATWYVTALALLSLTQAPLPCAVGLAALGVGDPLAALVGRRWGRVRLIHGRSLEGTLAFFGTATVAGALTVLAFAPTVGLGLALAVGAAGALFGALAELLSLRIDDNLSVPVVGAMGAAIVATLLGVPLA